jgi:hypothetical protein
METTRTTIESSRREALAFAHRTLTDAGIAHFVIPTYVGELYRLGVLARDRAAALAALRAVPGQWRARRRSPRAGGRKQVTDRAVPIADLPDEDQPAIDVFRPHRWERADFRLGGEAGVTVEFWAETPRGWDAPLRNPVACLIPPAGQAPVATTVAGASYPTVTALDATPWDEIDVPIDVVYTWVDGSDPEWTARRDERLRALGGPDAVRREARDEVRFADHGELRYSLRSLEQFLPWVRTVHLVTAGQRPAWLVDDHPRLRLVDHRDILEPGALPTFNSLAIETALHRIDGLSESYLYFNDDVFAGRSLTPRDFFVRPDRHRFFLQPRAALDPGPPTPDDLPAIGADKNARGLLEQRFGHRFSTMLAHTPHPQQRAVLAEIEHEFPDEVAQTRRSSFRGPDNIPMAVALHHYYAFFTGRAVPSLLRYRGVVLGGSDLKERLRTVLARRPQTFCLVDTRVDTPEPARKARIISRSLERYFPEPSSFERAP